MPVRVRPWAPLPTRLLDTRKADRGAVVDRRDADRREGDRRIDDRRTSVAARAAGRVGAVAPRDAPSRGHGHGRAPLVFAIVLACSIAAVVGTYLATR